MTRSQFHDQISEARLKEELRRHPTPCYLFFAEIIHRQIERLRGCVGPRFHIHYALKANPNPQILKLMAEAGLGADVASAGEIHAALDAGFAPGMIEFSGPGKSPDELALAAARGIGSLNVESLSELELLADICKAKKLTASVGVRINPDLQKNDAGIRMAGETQFGVSEDQAEAALEIIEKHGNLLRFTGIHVHAGSQHLDHQTILDTITYVLDMALDLEEISGMALEKVNLGGGWGVPYYPGQSALNLDQIAEGLRELFDEPDYADLATRARMILEPGRFLVAESGVYCTKVLYRKQVRAASYAVVDGGMHQNYLLAGGMGQVIRRNFETAVLPHPDMPAPPPAALKLNVAGRLCTPQDLLATDLALDAEVRPGDVIVFYNAGAYGLTASPLRFLSHDAPSEVVVV